MIAYLDTHVAVYLAEGTIKRISRTAQKLIGRAELLISPMVVLELELLYERGRIVLRAPEIQSKLEVELGVRVCDLPFGSVASVAVNGKWTRDPFDRIIVAQAKANGMAQLISADEMIAQHYPRTVW